MMDERYTAYEPTMHEDESPRYEWEDYEEEEEEELRPSGPRILWGRVVALLVLLFLIFLIGWWMAPNGISQDQFDEAVAQRDDAEQQVTDLQADLDDLQAQVSDLETQLEEAERTADEGGAAATTGTDAAAGGGEDGEAAAGDGENQYYTVQTGDTLAEIAIQFYEDPFLADVIAEANPEISDPDRLEIGDTLIIPDRPEL